MDAVRIHRTLESDTLHLPELKPLVGQRVEIIVRPEGTADSTQSARAGKGDWAAARRAVEQLNGYDFDAWQEQREFDRRHGGDHLP